MAELTALSDLTPLARPVRFVARHQLVDLALAGRLFVVRLAGGAGGALADVVAAADVVALDVPLYALETRRWPRGLHAVLVTPHTTLVSS